MFNIGDIIFRNRNPYRGVLLGTRGEILKRTPPTYPVLSQVLILDGDYKGEKHSWRDEYVELDFPPTPDWEV